MTKPRYTTTATGFTSSQNITDGGTNETDQKKYAYMTTDVGTDHSAIFNYRMSAVTYDAPVVIDGSQKKFQSNTTSYLTTEGVQSQRRLNRS